MSEMNGWIPGKIGNPKQAKAGGSAFPNGMDMFGNNIDGMSLRDYFAAQVISGCAEDMSPMVAALAAYELADAMLEARKK